MRVLETIGVFRQASSRVFENTPTNECLRKDVPGSKWASIHLNAPGWGYWEGYGHLMPTIQTGKTAMFDAWGYDICEYNRRNPRQRTVFNEANFSRSRQTVEGTLLL
jgi:hypothetical protein